MSRTFLYVGHRIREFILRHSFWRVGVLALLAIATLAELARFLRLEWMYLQGGIWGDATMYFGMGRGILNGLTMYIDLFESKPPGVYWLSALSLLISGDEKLYLWTHFAALALIPLLLGVIAFVLIKKKHRRTEMIGLSILFGTAIATFTVSRSHGFQSEGFGVFATIAATVMYVLYLQKRKLWFAMAAITFTALAALIKEPFVLAVAASFLLLSHSWKDLKAMILILIAAGLLSLVILYLAGVADEYFTLYLPEMMSGRVLETLTYTHYGIGKSFNVSSPVWIRGLNIWKLLQDMIRGENRSVFPLLAVTIVAIVLGQGLSIDRSRLRHLLMSLAGMFVIGIGIYCASQLFLLEQAYSYFGHDVWGDDFFRTKVSQLVILLITWIIVWVIIFKHHRPSGYTLLGGLLAIYIASVAVGIGGNYWDHHFLFATPIFVSGFISLTASKSWQGNGLEYSLIVAMIASLLILNSFGIGRNEIEVSQWRLTDQNQKKDALAAKELDSILYECNIDRYFMPSGGMPIYGYSKHSPFQLYWGIIRAVEIEPYNKQLRGKYFDDFNNASVILMSGSSEFPVEELRERFEKEFRIDPPDCVQGNTVLSDGHRLYFRRGNVMDRKS